MIYMKPNPKDMMKYLPVNITQKKDSITVITDIINTMGFDEFIDCLADVCETKNIDIKEDLDYIKDIAQL